MNYLVISDFTLKEIFMCTFKKIVYTSCQHKYSFYKPLVCVFGKHLFFIVI